MTAVFLSCDPIRDPRYPIARTLQSNNRVWFVGGLYFQQPGEAPTHLPGPADTDFRWNSGSIAIFGPDNSGTLSTPTCYVS
jgi:hypothetical protein